MSAMNQKINEVGWFYHAPAKRMERKEPVGAPPPSQIPGLGEVAPLEREEPRDVVFRETDTKYIRMAKMGGRKDLLSIKPNVPKSKEDVVSYPRNDWFYLEDNELQDRAERAKEQVEWQFMLPEYMVHQSHGTTTVNDDGPEGSVPMRRAPYATVESESQFSRDGQSMTDKTVKIPEVRPPGYGVRSGKPAPRGPMAKLEKGRPPQSSQLQGDRPRLKHQPLPSEPEEPTKMNKLLANTYEREWHDRVNQWQEKQGHSQDKGQAFTGKDRPVRSEYNNNYNNASGSSQKSQRRGSGASKGSAQRKEEEPKKEPFKMSKFKNVPARINTHQSPEVLATVGN